MFLPILGLCVSQDLIRPGVRWWRAEAQPANCHRWVINNPTFRTVSKKKNAPPESRFLANLPWMTLSGCELAGEFGGESPTEPPLIIAVLKDEIEQQ